MVVGGLLGQLMWRHQTVGGLCKIVEIVYDYGMRFAIVVLYIVFYCALNYYLKHTSVYLDYAVFNW